MKNIVELNTLVVDDEIISAEVTTSILKNYTHDNDVSTYKLNIRSENNSVNAIDELLSGKYDFAVLDYKMPVKDGLEVAKAVKSKDSKIPLIMVSTYDISEKFLHEAGIEAFTNKINFSPNQNSTDFIALSSLVDGIFDKIIDYRKSKGENNSC